MITKGDKMENREYPYIGIAKDTGLKVVFIDSKAGFVIEELHQYFHGFYWTDWDEEVFILRNKNVEDLRCVIAETIEDLKEIEEGLGVEKGKYFKHYYSYEYGLPAVIWLNNDGIVSHNYEFDEYHRVLFKDYAIWSKDKEKAKEILNISTTVEMTLEEICKALGKNIKIVKETK